MCNCRSDWICCFRSDCPRAKALRDERQEAFRRWREREASFPAFVRRPPDKMDIETGAWEE